MRERETSSLGRETSSLGRETSSGYVRETCVTQTSLKAKGSVRARSAELLVEKLHCTQRVHGTYGIKVGTLGDEGASRRSRDWNCDGGGDTYGRLAAAVVKTPSSYRAAAPRPMVVTACLLYLGGRSGMNAPREISV